MQYCTEFSRLETEYLHMTKKRIGILGGSFNPIHNGHIKMAYIALYEFLLGEVLFIPLGTPPHKPNSSMASTKDRLAMIDLAIADEKRFSVSTIETQRQGLTYTVDTLELLSRSCKDASFYYIIGADTVFELQNWKNYERVFFLTNFICILRPGQNEARVRCHVDALNARFGQKIYIADEHGPDISASYIRSLVVSNKLKDGLVPNKVSQYLIQNKVYNNIDA